MLAAQLTPEAPPLMRITCDRYHAMIAGGGLTPEDRVELIDGYLITKMSIGPHHSAVVTKLERLLDRKLEDRAIVRGQNPVTIHDYSEPEPDVVVARFRQDYYATRHPHPEDVLLVIEVADSSLAFDRNAKIPLYAAAGIPETWLVDLAESQILVFRKPEGVEYLEMEIFGAGDTLPVPGFEDATLAVNDLSLPGVV